MQHIMLGKTNQFYRQSDSHVNDNTAPNVPRLV